jgi:hypothetical protein
VDESLPNVKSPIIRKFCSSRTTFLLTKVSHALERPDIDSAALARQQSVDNDSGSSESSEEHDKRQKRGIH